MKTYESAIRELVSMGTYANVVSKGVPGAKGMIFMGHVVGSNRIDDLTYEEETKQRYVIRPGGDQDHISKYIPIAVTRHV